METVLLMFSGGVDSAYLLYHYLTQTNLAVHVHHISLRYPHLQRWKMEDPAVQQILQYCRKHYRGFDFSESRFDMEAMPLVGRDSDLQLLVAAKVAPNLPGEKVTVVLGQCPEDVESPEAQDRLKRKVLANLWQALRESVAGCKEKLDPHVARPLLEQNITKEQMMRELPAAILRLCWSCRRPRYIEGKGIPCGNCQACKRNKTVLSKSGRCHEFPNLVSKVSQQEISVRSTAPSRGLSVTRKDRIPDMPTRGNRHGSAKACMLPFRGVSISPNGKVRPCCYHGGGDHFQKLVSLDEIRWENSDVLRLRQQMLTGREPVECTICYENEKAGNRSYRNKVNDFLAEKDRPLTELINNPEHKYVDVQFGQLCNLSCLTCSPFISSHLQQTRSLVAKNNLFSESLRSRYRASLQFSAAENWTLNEASYRKVKELCAPVEMVKITGGEPLINPRFKDFMRYLLNKTPKVKFLYITTNGTQADPETLELIADVEEVVFRVSADGIGPLDEFIRFPTSWPEKVKNLQIIKSILQKKKLIVNSVIQAVNLAHYHEFFRSGVFSGFEKNFVILSHGSPVSHYNANRNYLEYCQNLYLRLPKLPVSEYGKEHNPPFEVIARSIETALDDGKNSMPKRTDLLYEDIRVQLHLTKQEPGILGEFFKFHNVGAAISSY